MRSHEHGPIYGILGDQPDPLDVELRSGKVGKGDDDMMATGRQTEDRDNSNLCTDLESANGD